MIMKLKIKNPSCVSINISMRKFIVTLLVFAFLCLAPNLASNSYAQEVDEDFDFARAYKDYVFVLDNYNSEHAEYLLAKAQYKQAGTLVSQTKAREETIDMLEARDEVVIIYLTAVRMKLLEAEGVSDLTKNGLFTRLDAEIAWYRDHKSRIASAGTLADLEDDSQDASDRFSSLSQSIAYEALAAVPFGKLSVMRDKTNEILTDINVKIFEIRANGDKDTTNAERWASEVSNKITRSLDKEIEAQAEIPKLAPNNKQKADLRGIYNGVIFKLEESRQFLRDATERMGEIVRIIIIK